MAPFYQRLAGRVPMRVPRATFVERASTAVADLDSASRIRAEVGL
ncbi:MAG: hypothetical protein VX466_10895 [Myxococcota bacterium]|nr:hypothetical protein [Myxococcota bacterium]